MIDSKVDVILLMTSGGARAATRATDSVPIVLCGVGEDPVRQGWVSSLARPGGNVTGTVTLAAELEGKRLELLKEAVPGLSRAAVLWNPKTPGHQSALLDVEAAARRLGIRIIPVEWKGPGDSEKAFQLASRERASGVLALTTPAIWRAREEIARVALKHRLPTAGIEGGFAEAGNLIQYGPDRAESCRRAASHVDRILKGAKPADLPIELATRFELLVNLKDREGARTEDPAVGPGAGGSGHRVVPSPDLTHRRALLTAALGFALLDTRGKPAPPEVQTVRKWLGTWRGLGDVVVGMNRQGYRLDLSSVDASAWRATFSRAPCSARMASRPIRRRGGRCTSRRGAR
jgi:putative ABC transport system substrate-binding protein